MRSQARAFTLVELMVALTIGLLVAGVIATMFASNARTYAFTSSVGDLQDAGRVAFETLQRDLRAAGYRGCDSSGRADAPALQWLARAAAADTAQRAAGTDAPAARGDAIPLRAWSGADADSLELLAPFGDAFALAQPMADPAAALRVADARGAAAGDLLLISDCSAAALFRATPAGAGELGHDLRANHAAALPRAFGSDALLTRMEWRRYFVAPYGAGADRERALWRETSGHPPQLVARHVQALRVQLGIDTDGDGAPNRFVRPGEMQAADWPRLAAVQVGLLLRGAAARGGRAAVYVFDGQAVTPTDGRMYRVISATVPLWNRGMS